MSNLPKSTVDALTNGPANISATPSGATVFDGPDAVMLYRLMAIRSALRIEVNTGLKMSRGSMLQAANAAMGTNYKTKAKALAAMEALLERPSE